MFFALYSAHNSSSIATGLPGPHVQGNSRIKLIAAVWGAVAVVRTLDTCSAHDGAAGGTAAAFVICTMHSLTLL